MTRPHVVRVRVSVQEKAWLDEVAAAQDRSVSQVLRRALRLYYFRHFNGDVDRDDI